MAIYKNDFSKKEDYCLWELHQIRNNLANKKETPAQINKRAEEILSQYYLSKKLAA